MMNVILLLLYWNIILIKTLSVINASHKQSYDFCQYVWYHSNGDAQNLYIDDIVRKNDVNLFEEDNLYEVESSFIQRTKNHPSLSHLGNEKKLLSILTSYNAKTISLQQCLSSRGIGVCPYIL